MLRSELRAAIDCWVYCERGKDDGRRAICSKSVEPNETSGHYGQNIELDVKRFGHVLTVEKGVRTRSF